MGVPEPPSPQPRLPQRSPSRTCMISHRPSAPARVPVVGIILCQREKRKAVVPRRKEDGRAASEPSPSGTSYNPDGCSHPGSLTPSSTGGCGGWGRVRRCWGARVVGCPHPPSRPWCVCGRLTTLSQPRGDWGSVPLHSRHIRPFCLRLRPLSAAWPLHLPRSSQL